MSGEIGELFSAGGLFYVAQCHEKAARGFVVVGGGNLMAMKSAATAVSTGTKVSLADDLCSFRGGA